MILLLGQQLNSLKCRIMERPNPLPASYSLFVRSSFSVSTMKYTKCLVFANDMFMAVLLKFTSVAKHCSAASEFQMWFPSASVKPG